MRKIYIAGKVTGLDPLEVAEKFELAEKELRKAGFEPINPLKVVGTFEVTWQEAMRKCIAALVAADGVYALPCYRRSRGALIEENLARALELPVSVNSISFLRMCFK